MAGKFVSTAKARLFAVAAAATVILASGVVALTWGFLEQAEYQRTAERSGEQYAADTYRPAYNACLMLPAQNQADCIAKANAEYRENRREEQDLAAQRTAAVWSFLMGAAAIVGVMLSALGIFLVWTTYQAARAGNVITQRIGEAQTRAYLSVTRAEIDLASGTINPSVRFWLKNSGQSPARDCYVRLCCGVTSGGRIVRADEDYPAGHGGGGFGIDIAAGHEASIGCMMQFDPTEDLKGLGDNLWNIDVLAKLSFKDVFGDIIEERISWVAMFAASPKIHLSRVPFTAFEMLRGDKILGHGPA